MAGQSTCSHCGNLLKDQWLVCKYCHQARWKLITPYFIWGAIFLVGSGLSLTLKPSVSDDLFTLLLPVIAVVFGLIGLVMLLIALIASLRGLSVRKVVSAPPGVNPLGGHMSASSSPVRGASSNTPMPAVSPSIPRIIPRFKPPEITVEKTNAPAIHCQKCKHENATSAKNCARCGANLLPGTGIGQRLGVLVSSLVLTVLCFAAAFLLFFLKPEIGGKDIIYFAALVGFGIVVLLFGIYWLLRKTPLYERYAVRAKYHASLDPWQAIADYGSAIQNAPQPQAFDYLLERAKIYQGLSKTLEARSDWQHALENINARLAKPKASLDLIKQRAEIHKYLGMEDEYAMQMLMYTIEKEKTFKTRRGQIAMGWEEGIQKGSEDAKRQELSKLRAEIMLDQKYRIIGQCKNCRSIVYLDANLDCINNPKHRNISNIQPTIGQSIRT